MSEESNGGTQRTCTNCGKSVEEESYEFWVFRTCRTCAAEPAPDRWADYSDVAAGTYRKWRYFPRWHMTAHPDLPARIKARHEGTA